MLSLRDLTRQHFYLVDMVSDLKRKSLTLIDRIFPEYPTLFSDTFGTNAENFYIQKQITKTAAQDIVKNTLEKIGIYALNRKNKKQIQNFDGKLNTHSLRKTFSDWFYNTGVLLKERGELNLDTEILKLLQEKFMHSSMSVTNRYNKVMEENFRYICQRMNIGLEALENI